MYFARCFFLRLYSLLCGPRVCFDEERDRRYVEHNFFRNQYILHIHHTKQTVYLQSMSIKKYRSFWVEDRHGQVGWTYMWTDWLGFHKTCSVKTQKWKHPWSWPIKVMNIFWSAGARGRQADKEWLWWIEIKFFSKEQPRAVYAISHQTRACYSSLD